VAGSTTNIAIGSTTGTSTTTVNGTFSAQGDTNNIGSTVTTSSIVNIGTGITASGSTKTVLIGTASAAGSTTNITIGSIAGTSTTTLHGITNGVTEAVDTNNTELATTAFVVGQAGSATPLVNGTAAVGTSLRYARQDHVHGTDTTRAPLASPTFTGTVTIPAGASISGFAPLASPSLTGTPLSTTAAADTNTTQIATTAFVVAQAAAATPLVDGTAAVGTSLRYARADHVHPTDTTRAPLASPALTGTPTAPTATAGTNTTQLATTAFVLANAGSTTYATASQALALTSNTVSISPLTLQRVIMHPSFRRITSMASNSVSTTSGTGSSNFVSSNWIENLGPTSGATGSAMVTPANVAGLDAIGRLSEANIDFSKRIILCGKFSQAAASGFLGDANNYWMFSLGKASNYHGNFTGRAIGIRKFGSTANFFLVVHDGTTLTAVDSGVGNNSNSATTDFTIVSDGAGNVTLFIDDNQVATTSAGPTGTATSGSRIYAEVNQVGTFGARIGAHTGNIGIYIAP
jgi:hypothetical protein